MKPGALSLAILLSLFWVAKASALLPALDQAALAYHGAKYQAAADILKKLPDSQAKNPRAQN